jgi:L-threonylcarbamoyladenylate synthase
MISTNIQQAVALLIQNEVVAIPTETVYGLAANAYNEDAVIKIFEIKKRPLFNPLIVHIKSASTINEVAKDIPEIAYKLLDAFWPGPLTLILNKQAHIPDIVTAGKQTVAIRMPNHPIALDLLQKLDFPLAAPSANPFSTISPTSAAHVAHYFNEELSLILDGGECQKGLESTIVGFENNEAVLYRYGAISTEDIEKIIGSIKIKNNNEHQPDAPGMLSKHYSPKTETYLTNNVEQLIKSFPNKKIGVLTYKNKIANNNICYQEILSHNEDLNEAAQNLYASLHRLDCKNLDLIITERLPENGLGITINDRLQRAISKN